MKTKWIVLIIFICVCISSFITCHFTYNNDILKNYNIQKCSNDIESVCKDEENCCIIWDNDHKVCRKGVMKNGQCRRINNIIPFVFAILGLVSVVVIIIVLLLCLGEYVTGQKTIYYTTKFCS